MKTITYKIFALFLMLVLLTAGSSQEARAQLDKYGWRIGFGTGYMSYYGDLSTGKTLGIVKEHYKFEKDKRLSYTILLERRITPGVSLMMSGNRGFFEASDRDDPESKFFERALNFRTNINDLNASFVFKTDNDRLLSERFFLAPYFYLGAGITHFKVLGDLKDSEGNYYNYVNNNPELDGRYDTNLEESGPYTYPNLVPHVNAGIGLRLRFLYRLSLHLQTDLKYALSDYLDNAKDIDYADEYETELEQVIDRPNPKYVGIRAKNNNWNDIYGFTSLSLRFSFGRRIEGFTPPIFLASPEEENAAIDVIDIIETEVEVGDETIIVYDTIRVVNEGYETSIDSSAIKERQALLDSLEQVSISNAEMQEEMEKAMAEYEKLKAETEAAKTEEIQTDDNDSLIVRMDSLEQAILELSIAGDNNQGDDSTEVDEKQMEDLKRLRKEVEKMKKKEKKKKKENEDRASTIDRLPTVVPLYQPPPPTTVSPPPASTNVVDANREIARANSVAEMYYARYQAQIDALNQQMATLTAAIAAQNRQVVPQYAPQQPYIIQQPAAAAPAGTDPQLLNTLQTINQQLGALNGRIIALESRSTGGSGSSSPTIVTTPGQNYNDAELRRSIDDLRRQISDLSSKVSSLQSRPVNTTTSRPYTGSTTTTTTTSRPYTGSTTITTQPSGTSTWSSNPARTITQPTRTYIEAVRNMGNVTVYFDLNSSVIKQSELTKLKNVANVLKLYPNAQITINGYADATGSSDFNRKLSQKRAETVRDRLINGFGVHTGKVILNALGDTQASGGVNQNDRRVDLKWVE